VREPAVWPFPPYICCFPRAMDLFANWVIDLLALLMHQRTTQSLVTGEACAKRNHINDRSISILRRHKSSQCCCTRSRYVSYLYLGVSCKSNADLRSVAQQSCVKTSDQSCFMDFFSIIDATFVQRRSEGTEFFVFLQSFSFTSSPLAQL